MQVAVFSARRYDRRFLDDANVRYGHQLHYLECPLMVSTLPLLPDVEAVCVFVNDCVDAAVLKVLAERGVRTVALRCAGYDNVDLEAAASVGVVVVRVPAYSPQSIAEHAVTLLLALNRHLHKAYTRVREGNFALQGLLGGELQGKTVGLIGTGRIGAAVAKILTGFGCRILAVDPEPQLACRAMGVTYVDLESLLQQSQVVSLHCPLLPATHHLIDACALQWMPPGGILINTSRGAVVDSQALLDALKQGHLAAAGLDVYEREGALFFTDRSDQVLQDDVFACLQSMPNVIITGHQAFFTEEAMQQIAEVTLSNLREIEQRLTCSNTVSLDL